MLKRLEGSRTDHGAKIEAARKTITEHTNELTKKAPIETEAQGNYHKEWLTKIQAHLDSNADVDLMDLRLKQDQLTTTLEEVQIDVNDKCSKDEVEDKLTSKFEELTDNLTIALDAVKADDKDFKACIQKCEDGMDVLRASKSDKTEIADLRAQLTAQLQVVQKTASAAAIPPEVAEELATCLRRDEVVPMLEGKASTENVKQIADATARADGRLATLAEAIDSVHANTMQAAESSTQNHWRQGAWCRRTTTMDHTATTPITLANASAKDECLFKTGIA